MKLSKKQVKVNIEGKDYLVEVGDTSVNPVLVTVDGEQYEVFLGDIEQHTSQVISQAVKPSAPDLGLKTITAPMPGDIVEVLVESGDQVRMGQPLCVLEAMKMKNVIRSPRDGKVASVKVAAGQEVTAAAGKLGD